MSRKGTKNKPQQGECVVCKTKFIKFKYDSKYCSAICRTEDKKYKVEILEKTCLTCNCIFMPEKTTIMYCSNKCRHESRKKRNAIKIIEKIVKCGKCPNQFKPNSSSHKYCSYECKALVRNEDKKRHREKPEVREKIREYDRKRWASLDDRVTKNRNLMAMYGITIEQYEQLLKDQNGNCAICKLPPEGLRPLCVDHSHENGKVRALCCLKCNNLLGNSNEDLTILNNAMDYIIEWQKKHEYFS